MQRPTRTVGEPAAVSISGTFARPVSRPLPCTLNLSNTAGAGSLRYGAWTVPARAASTHVTLTITDMVPPRPSALQHPNSRPLEGTSTITRNHTPPYPYSALQHLNSRPLEGTSRTVVPSTCARCDPFNPDPNTILNYTAIRVHKHNSGPVAASA